MNWQAIPGAPLLRRTSLLTPGEAEDCLDRLQSELLRNNGTFEAFGRRFPLPRLQAWHADPGVEYRYARQLHNSRPWTPALQALRLRIEDACAMAFNAVLANYYRNGQDCVGWHADDEPDLGPAPAIASLSLGATRVFSWRRRGDPSSSGANQLPAGTLLLMVAPFQRDFEHAILSDPAIHSPRLNLTFRQVLGS